MVNSSRIVGTQDARVPHVLLDVAVPALLRAYVERAEHTADDGRHGAIGAAAVDPEARADDDDVNQHRVAHELRFGYWVDVAEHEPEADGDDYSPADHDATFLSAMTR